LPIAIGLVVAAGLGTFAALRLRPAPAPPPRPAEAPTETREARKERLARACDATRAAMYRGATFGSMAMEGWVVELWLARRGKEPLGPSLRDMVDGDKLAPAADEALARVPDGLASVEEGADGEEVRPSPAISEARLVLREGYAREFFELEARERFVRLGGRLAAKAGADFGALHARCAHLRAHDVGAWFVGRTGGDAAAALVYQMGLYAGVPVVDRAALGRLAGAGDLDALGAAAGAIDASALASLVREDGGKMAPGDRVSVAFPFGGPTRATSASRAVARKLGMAPPG
jgi:serine/threonine-protein kinase